MEYKYTSSKFSVDSLKDNMVYGISEPPLNEEGLYDFQNDEIEDGQKGIFSWASEKLEKIKIAIELFFL